MRATLPLLVLGLVLLCAPGRAVAQTADPVPEIVEAYQQVDYDRAETLARAALANLDGLQPAQLVEIHKVLAFISLSRGYEGEAERHVISALSLNPELELDPALVSPVVIAFFEEVRATAELEPPEPEAPVRYVVVQDVRAAAALRSLVLPGWGQLHKRQPGRAAAFAAAWAGAATATALSHVRYHDAQDRYERATTPAIIADAYDEANGWYRLRNNLALGTAAVWAGSALEALLSPGGPPEGWSLRATPGGAALRLRM